MTLLTSYFVNKQQQQNGNKNNVFLSLSKGRSLNNSPVFDLWVYNNGQVIYKGIEHVEKLGIHKTYIGLEIVSKIKKLIENSSFHEIGDAKGRDNPLTLLRYNNRKIVFQTTRVNGNLLKLNELLDYIIDTEINSKKN